MTNKLFYQLAADEVAQGNVDQALWIKVVADMPSAAKVQQQAKYIQLRAGELAIQSATTRVVGFVPTLKRLFIWGLAIVVLGFAAMLTVLFVAAHFDDQRMREHAITNAEVLKAHLSNGESDSAAYQSQVLEMNNLCSYWDGQRNTDKWIKGTDEQNASASAACDQVSAELKRVLHQP